MIYALKGPEGIIEETVASDADEAWANGYSYIGAIDPSFHTRYWKQWSASIKAARKLGFRVVACKVTPTDKRVRLSRHD